MVSLIHDGFGEALLGWSDACLQGPQGALHAITGSHGDSFDWKRAGTSRRGSSSMLSNETPRVFANLRWRGSGVHADLRRVVFVNCDFRSAFFRECRLDGVTFVNCMLENAVLMNCDISKSDPADRARPYDRGPGAPTKQATFRIPLSSDNFLGVDQSSLRIAADYRGIEGDHFALLAQAPDLPAIPVPLLAADVVSDWAPHLGGMALYGTRVSSMVIRYCTGDIALRHCTGDGFGIDDHGSGRIEVHGCRLRQVRVTSGTDHPHVNISCIDSALAQVWLGEDLRGEFVAQGGTLLQVWNESAELDAVATRSAVYGTVGLKLMSCHALPGLGELYGTTTVIRSDDAFDGISASASLRLKR